MKRVKRVLDSYVPRHMRLGVSCMPPVVEFTQNIVENVNVVSKGSSVYSQRVLKSVTARENMQKYKASAFRLSALVESGVPLKMIQINHSNSVEIDKLQKICASIEGAEHYLQRVDEQRKERDSWFSPIVEEK